MGPCLLLNGCASAHVHYLQEGTGHTREEEVISKWGQPDERQVEGSGEMWGYRFQQFDSMEHPIGCEGFRLHFDQGRVLRNWSDLDC